MDRWTRGSGAPTHLLMNGGKLFVPSADNKLLLNILATDVVKGVERHVVERRTPLFKLFFDIDAHVWTSCATEPEWQGVVKVIWKTVAASLELDDDSIVACRAPPRELDAEKMKHGFHLHFPGAVVSNVVALALRKKCVDALDESFPEALAVGWDAALDPAVFGGSGLRLPWQLKGAGTKKLGVYAPWFERVDGEWNFVDVEAVKSVSAARRYLHRCSVRCHPLETSTPLCAGSFTAEELEDLDSRDETGSAALATFGARKVATSRYDSVLPALENALPPVFAGQRFTAIMEADSCFLLRSSSRYCCNLARCHTSNNVFFVLRPGGIFQKCYCRCSTLDGRRSGLMCKEYSSEIWPVAPEVTDAFFANKFLDDLPIADHPEVGVEATKKKIMKQHQETHDKRRRRVMPSAIMKAELNVGAMLMRTMPISKNKRARASQSAR